MVYFLLAKILGALLYTSSFLIFVGLVGLLLLFSRFAGAGRRIALTAFILLIVCGVSPTGKWLLAPLEDRFSPWTPTAQESTGIIVLGGDIDLEIAAARGIVSPANPHRIFMAATLLRKYPRARMLYAGGSPGLRNSDIREADLAVELLGELGIPPSRIEIERRSRNAAENAQLSRNLISLKPTERWLLVTSAFHMPRAIGLFCKAGFVVEAVPSVWQTDGKLSFEPESFPRGLSIMDVAAHEWLALFVARVTRKTDFFPGKCTVSG